MESNTIQHLMKLASGLDREGYLTLADQIDSLLSPSLLKKAESEADGNLHDLPIVCSVALFRWNKKVLEVLIESRGKPPKKHRSALIGGHLESNGENYAECAARETEEETSVKIKPEDLIYVTERIRNEPKRKRDILYTAIVPMEDSNAVAGDDAEQVDWTPITELPELAWDHELFIMESLRKVLRPQQELKINLSDVHLPVRCNYGMLVVVEGQDGSGKSTQIAKLYEALKSKGYKVEKTKWASSDFLKKVIKDIKKRTDTTETLYSMLNAADMHVRYMEEILPALSDNSIVLCDRYLYTSYARDVCRGVDPAMLDLVYKNFLQPDLVFYCKVPPTVALRRLKRDGELSYWGSGVDLHLDPNPEKNFIQYHKQMEELYTKIFDQVDTAITINANKDVDEVADTILDKVLDVAKKRKILPK